MKAAYPENHPSSERHSDNDVMRAVWGLLDRAESPSHARDKRSWMDGYIAGISALKTAIISPELMRPKKEQGDD